MRRCRDLAIFVPTMMTDIQTDYFTPAAHARGVIKTHRYCMHTIHVQARTCTCMWYILGENDCVSKHITVVHHVSIYNVRIIIQLSSCYKVL